MPNYQNTQRTIQNVQVRPQAMTGHPGDSVIRKEFYNALLMLEVLGMNRGVRQEEEAIVGAGTELAEMTSERHRRRTFLKHLAFSCDFEDSGRRTTAIAVEAKPEGNVFWFASNIYPRYREQRDVMKNFLSWALKCLKSVRLEDVPGLERDLFDSAVYLSGQKIWSYARRLRIEVQNVFEVSVALNINEGSFSAKTTCPKYTN